ncbi:MAG: CDP-diacylglycerol--glycerol-3-phosphate 3-phosphatidyltransferase, partial [Ruminococcus sp.]|nr:CDP-diacylglycerol--glycerol-3-phosphate 3-phosphatidyltransferase [Ruminococcus sp.]
VFVQMSQVPMGAIPLIIIIAREFMVSGLRLLAADSGVVVAAGIWGKLKTAFTMVTIIAILLWLSIAENLGFDIADSVYKAVDIITIALVWISTALTVISGAVYLKGYWHLIDSDK